jgi:hypothetical protein
MRSPTFALFAFLCGMPAHGASIGPSLGPTLVPILDGVNEFTLSVGLFHPTGTFGFLGIPGDRGERFGSTGNLVAIDYLRAVNRYAALGVEGAYISRSEYKATNVFVAPAITQVRGDSKLLLLVFRLRAPGDGLRPYVMGGWGTHRTHFELYGSIGGAEAALVTGDAGGTAWMGRGGIEYNWPGGSFVGLDGGFLRIADRSYSATNFGRLFGFQDVVASGDGLTYTLRMGFRFGSGP